MNQLMVRPIDDKRYSKSSQLDYVMLLKKHKSPEYSDALIKFTLVNYHEQVSKAANAFAKRVRVAVQAISDAFSKKRANNHQSHGIVHGGEYIISAADYRARRKLLDKHYKSERLTRTTNGDGEVVVTINVPTSENKDG